MAQFKWAKAREANGKPEQNEYEKRIRMSNFSNESHLGDMDSSKIKVQHEKREAKEKKKSNQIIAARS